MDSDFTREEQLVLEILGKLDISENKNINEATIRKKLKPKYRKNLPKVIKSLHTKQLLNYYRKENYCLTAEGRKLAQKLAEELRNKTYADLRILMIL